MFRISAWNEHHCLAFAKSFLVIPNNPGFTKIHIILGNNWRIYHLNMGLKCHVFAKLWAQLSLKVGPTLNYLRESRKGAAWIELWVHAWKWLGPVLHQMAFLVLHYNNWPTILTFSRWWKCCSIFSSCSWLSTSSLCRCFCSILCSHHLNITTNAEFARCERHCRQPNDATIAALATNGYVATNCDVAPLAHRTPTEPLRCHSYRARPLAVSAAKMLTQAIWIVPLCSIFSNIRVSHHLMIP